VHLGQWITRHACFAPDAPALQCGATRYSYAQLAARIELAAGRLAALGLGRGDVVAFLGLNNPEMLALLFACARLGALLTPLNWRRAPPELARTLAETRPQLLCSEPAFVAALSASAAQLRGVRCLALGPTAAPGWAEWEALAPAPSAPAAGEESAPLLVCHTSGTAGEPKGAVLTQRALLWNAINSAHMHDLTSADRVLTTLPLFHVGGLNIQTLPALHAGASVTLHPKFEVDAVFDTIERERITLTVLVPTQLVAMMEHPRWRRADLSSLRVISTGSTIIGPALIHKVAERGVPLIQVYGSTETCPIATYVRAADALRKAGSAGAPALHCEIRVVDDAGRDVPCGSDGEILVRGPSVMQGYWHAPEATAAALQDGYYHSGDVGHLDADGYLYVVSRKKDMIISGGENIYPAEVEGVLLECRAIEEVCVVGRPDERWGEIVVAAIVRRAGERLEAADVLALLDGRIARYKHPRTIVFLERLPRTALGKVKIEEVRAVIADRRPQAEGAHGL
jgi:fatty-acyl-CoA synthase